MLLINANNILVRGRPIDSEQTAGLFVAPGGFTGWDDGVDVRRESIARPMAHGEFDVPSYLGARVITVDGWAIAAGPDELGLLRSIVTGMGAGGDVIRLGVDHLGQQLGARARIGAKTTFVDAGIRESFARARFVWQMVCADPRKYGISRTVASGVAAVNNGNFGASPILEVKALTSMPSGWSIAGPGGKLVSTTQALTVGQVHRYDTATGRLTRNGVRARADVRADTWVIPGGGSFVHTVTPVSGTGSLETTTPDVFI